MTAKTNVAELEQRIQQEFVDNLNTFIFDVTIKFGFLLPEDYAVDLWQLQNTTVGLICCRAPCV